MDLRNCTAVSPVSASVWQLSSDSRETSVLEYNDMVYSDNISGKVHITSLNLCHNVLCTVLLIRASKCLAVVQ